MADSGINTESASGEPRRASVFGRLVRFSLPPLIIAASVAGFFLLKIDTVERQNEIQYERSWPVHVQTVSKRVLVPQVQLFGNTVSPLITTLSSILDGRVLSVHVQAGDYVELDDVLVEFDARNLETVVTQLRADIARILAQIASEDRRFETDQEMLEYERNLLALAAKAAERVRSLVNRRLESESRLEEAEKVERQAKLAVTLRESSVRQHDARRNKMLAELKKVQISLDSTLRDIEESTIVAPYAGRISKVNVAADSRIRNGAEVLEMFNHHNIEIMTVMPSRYLQRVRGEGRQIHRLPAVAMIDGYEFDLVLDRLAATVEPGTGGVAAYFRILNGDFFPELGRAASLTMSLPAVEDAVTIPYRSVYGANQVFKVVDDRLKSVEIERIGQIMLDGELHIVASSSELQPLDKLLLTPLSNAADALKVEPVDMPASANGGQSGES